jgi:signal transduction histidine kinase
LDEYAKKVAVPDGAPVAKTTEGSIKVVEDNLKTAKEAKETAAEVAAKLQTEIEKLESDTTQSPQRATIAALRIANNAIKAVDDLRAKLTTSAVPQLDLERLKQEIDLRSEQATSLIESAAVGLSARGLAHELRTYLTEIRQHAAVIEKLSKKRGGSEIDLLPNLRAIRSACNSISNAMALIDPMLPKSRTLKETFELRDFVEKFIASRMSTLESLGIKTVISGAGRTVRANKGRLTQVIDNLFRNSVYWIRQIPEKVENARRITISLTEDGFNVSDSGPGVDERYEDSLFEIFVSGKPSRDGGQGLGLFITKELLQMDGCDIELLGGRNDSGRRYKFAVDLSPLIKS